MKNFSKKLLTLMLVVFAAVSLMTVASATEGNVAKIGGTEYETLAAAVAAATDGQTVTLLRDTVGGGVMIKAADAKRITIDLDTHTYTFTDPAVGSTGTETQGFHFENGCVITVMNGTLRAAEGNQQVKMLIQNYCDLTLDDVVIDGTNVNGTGCYVLSNNCGNTTIKKTTITAKDGDFAFDSCKFKKYSIPTVNVESGSKINGKIELTGGKVNLKNGAIVNGMVRIGENKAGTTVKDSIMTIESGATVNCQNSFVGVFGQNTLNIAGTVNGLVATNGNAYNGGSVINVLNGANVTNNNDVAIYMPNGELNISGGAITGATAVYFKSTKLNITDGTLNATGAKADYSYNGNGGNPTGDALVIDSCNYPNGIISVAVSGGTFTSTNNNAVASFTSQGADPVTAFITGGTFSSDPSAYVAPGYAATKSAGVWTVAAKVQAAVTVPETVDPRKFVITDTNNSGNNVASEKIGSIAAAMNAILDTTLAADVSKVETALDGTLTLDTKPTGMKARVSNDTITVSSYTFDVSPRKDGEAVNGNLEAFEVGVTFRLPLPYFTSSQAVVKHEEDAPVVYTVKGIEPEEKYIEVTATHFSEFTVEGITIEFEDPINGLFYGLETPIPQIQTAKIAGKNTLRVIWHVTNVGDICPVESVGAYFVSWGKFEESPSLSTNNSFSVKTRETDRTIDSVEDTEFYIQADLENIPDNGKVYAIPFVSTYTVLDAAVPCQW